MKKIIAVSTFLCLQLTLLCQQEFGFRYCFKPSEINVPGINLFRLDVVPDTNPDPVSYSLCPDTCKIYPYHPTEIIGSQRNLLSKLKGDIVDRKGDSIIIKFWNITSLVPTLTSPIPQVTALDNNHKFAIIISPSGWSHNSFFIKQGPDFINFRYYCRTFTAITIPLRIFVEDDQVVMKGEIINFNVAHIWQWGKTKVFRYEDAGSRNTCFGLGIFGGVNDIELDDETHTLGLSYGITYVQDFFNFNINLSVGIETGFATRDQNFKPFVGLGIGFDLLEFRHGQN